MHSSSHNCLNKISDELCNCGNTSAGLAASDNFFDSGRVPHCDDVIDVEFGSKTDLYCLILNSTYIACLPGTNSDGSQCYLFFNDVVL